MAKRKLTPEILELVELCAADEYTLDEICEESGIIRPLMEDPLVLEAINKGRVKWFIEIMATEDDIDAFIFYSGKTNDEIHQMLEVYQKHIELRKAEVQLKKKKIKDKKISSAKRHLTPSAVAGYNIYTQSGAEKGNKLDVHTLKEEIKRAVQKMQTGNTTALLEILTGNIMQLHHFNGQVALNLVGEVGKTLPNFEKLSNIQLKVMQETRKSIMAINEITNPKRTTFIKEANQHNHLHQNSEKKDESENELQRQLEKPDEILDAAIYVGKGRESEKK